METEALQNVQINSIIPRRIIFLHGRPLYIQDREMIGRLDINNIIYTAIITETLAIINCLEEPGIIANSSNIYFSLSVE